MYNFFHWISKNKIKRLANYRKDVPTQHEVNQRGRQDEMYLAPNAFTIQHGTSQISTSPINGAEYGTEDTNLKLNPHHQSIDTPNIALQVSQDYIPEVSRALHHLLNSHSGILKKGGFGKNNDVIFPIKLTHDPKLDKDEIQHTVSMGTPSESGTHSPTKNTIIKTNGPARTPQDIAKMLAKSFSYIFLDHLNTGTGTILHPAKDHIKEHTPYSSSYDTPDVNATKEIRSGGELGQAYMENDTLAKVHRHLLEEYILHHMNNADSDLSYASYLEKRKKFNPRLSSSTTDPLMSRILGHKDQRTPEGAATIDLIRDILGGKFRRG